MAIESVMPSNHLILCLSALLLPSVFPSMNLFQWTGSSHRVTKVLELQLQHQSFQWIVRVDFLYNWLLWPPWCPRDSEESSPALQFESINSWLLSGSSDGKASAYNAGDLGSIPGSGRSLEKEMATHSSIHAWKIPWPEKPGGLHPIGLPRVAHDWVTSLHFNLKSPVLTLYMSTGENIVLIIWAFVSKVMSLF